MGCAPGAKSAIYGCPCDAVRDQLLYAFDAVVHVDVLDSQDAANLQLLGRPELGLTFTKLQCWRLTQYSKCVFMDADTLVYHVDLRCFDSVLVRSMLCNG